MPILTPWLMGTKGRYSSISRPRQYNGNWGPGTFVVTVCTIRCGRTCSARTPSRTTVPTTIGGARSPMRVTVSPASAMWEPFSSAISSWTARNRSTGSSMWTGNRYSRVDTRLSGTPRPSVPLTETGTNDRTTASSGSSERDRNRSRNPALIAERTTSLTVPPYSARIAATSVRLADEWAQVRCGPIEPSIDSRRGAVRLRTKPPIPRPKSVTERTERRGFIASVGNARAPSTTSTARPFHASIAIAGPDGSAEGVHGRGAARSTSRVISSRTVRSSTPATPSTMQWCTLNTRAQRSSSTPSTSQVSQSGRLRSSG